MNGHVNNYAVVTLHRPSNVDDKETFNRIVESLLHISKTIPIIFPAHLRTQKQIEAFNMKEYFNCSFPLNHTGKIHIIEPLGYLEFLKLTSNAKLILSDSGGIQEETTILGVPCLTIRENTERPITITEGTNTLVGTSSEKIITHAMEILNGAEKVGHIPKFWDGKAAKRIINILMRQDCNC